MNEKITGKHLQRAAYIYIRQSTFQQVRQNVESHRRQYALEERARALGFREVVIVDEDLGISGAGHRERPGFGRLLAAVCSGAAGAVFALEASRLARNNRDWHHLIDLGVLTETAVVDADGVYDPRQLNDRLLLGLKGTMSEFELGILRQRAQEAYRQKIQRGEVLTRVPVGYVRGGTVGMEMTPDTGVQDAIRSVFRNFERFGSLRQALLWYHQEKVLLPVQRVCQGVETLTWRLPDYQHLLRIVRNPAYSGAFAYGRSGTRVKVIDGRSRKSDGHRVAMEDWQVLIKDHHAAYITWEQYMENQSVLTANRTKTHAACRGAAREGSALLQGVFRCARCGHKLHVAYRGRDGRAPRYYCLTGNKQQGTPSCLSFGAVKAEQAVVDTVLEACQPLGVEASLRALAAGEAEQAQRKRTLELAVERLRYETDLARRQFDAVDPANRLVAAELETRWNAALARLAEAESRMQAELQSTNALTEQQRARLLALGEDLRTAWHDPAATVMIKKRILRTVLNEIIVDLNHGTHTIEMRLHWAGGVHTELKIPKNKPGCHSRATSQDIIELVRELAKVQTDSHIAATLNHLGLRSGPGNTWNQTRVKHFRHYHQIPVYVEDPARTWMTMNEAAETLKVGVRVVRTMVEHGILPARQAVKCAPWIIESSDLKRECVQAYAKSARTGVRLPRNDNDQLLMNYE